MKAISDSTPLIHLSEIGGLHYLKNLFDEVIISRGVYEEVVSEGKKQIKNEVLPLEKFIEEKFIIVKEPKSIAKIERLDKGEKECISLCKELDIDTILIDEKIGFNICSIFNLIPIRTTSILIILLDKKIINLSKYKELLKRLPEKGYFLDASTYQKLLNIGENIAKE